MPVNKELLPREELIQLWHEIAVAFDTQLEVTVDDGVSLAMKFTFQNEYGQTQVGIKDLAGSGISHRTAMESYVITTVRETFPHKLTINLPPPLSGFLERYRNDVSRIYLNGTKYWVKSQSVGLREAITTGNLKGLADFDSLYLKMEEDSLILKTSSFLGRAHQIKAFINLYLSFLKLVSEQ